MLHSAGSTAVKSSHPHERGRMLGYSSCQGDRLRTKGLVLVLVSLGTNASIEETRGASVIVSSLFAWPCGGGVCS